MRVSSARGSPTLVFASRSPSACSTASRYCGRRHGAADGGALLPRLHRHLGRDFLDEQVELGRARRRVGPEQRGVEAVLLGDEADGLRGRPSGATCSFSAVCAEPVKLTTSWPVRWSNRSPTPPTISWIAPGGQDVRLDHDPERGFGRGRRSPRPASRSPGRRRAGSGRASPAFPRPGS